MANYDTLTITINADSKQANTSIKTLSNNLNKLNETAKNLDDKRIEEVKGLLLDIANIDFSNVSKGLQDIVSAFKSFQSKAFMKATMGGSMLSGARQSRLPTYEGTQIPQFEAFNQADLQGFDNFVDSLKDSNKLSKELYGNFVGIVGVIQSGLTPMEQLGQAFQNMGLNGKQMQAIFNSINYETDRFTPEQLDAIEQELKKVGYSGEEAKEVIARLKKELDETEKSGNKASRSLLKMFTNIMKYRVVRRIIQNIFQEITNALQELASVDKDFDVALGEIKSAVSYIARALTSVIAPVVKVIAPIITDLVQGLGEILSSLASTFAGVLGQTEFAEATESVETYTESLKKAQNAQMGFDKLNVISQGSEGNFQMKQTEATNNLGEILQKVGESIKPIIEALKSFIQKIQPLLQFIISITSQILNETMNDVNGSIASFIEALGSILEAIGLLLQVLKPILSLLTSFGSLGLNTINTLITLLSDLTILVLKPILPILQDLAELLKLIEPALHGISEGTKAITGSSENTGARVVAGILTGGLSEILRAIKNGGFATGGFPEDGLFMANHNELVGQFDNGRTAVANNQQITQGIYQAVLQAMRESGGNEVVVQLDGREIARAVNKQNANQGSLYKMGGINYGK